MFSTALLLFIYTLQTEVAPAILRPWEHHLSTGHVFLSLPQNLTSVKSIILPG